MVILETSSEITVRSSINRTNLNSSGRPLDFNTLYNDNSVTKKELESQVNAALIRSIPSGIDVIASVLNQRNNDDLNNDDEETNEFEQPQQENKSQNKAVQSAESVGTVVQEVKCLTPFKYGSINTYLFGEFGQLKSGLSKSQTDLQSTVDKTSRNFEDNLIRRYISRTVNGWDQQGMHYWLRKICKSNLHVPLVEESDSWFNIHICEKCTNRLNITHHFRYISQERLNDTDYESLLYATELSEPNSSKNICEDIYRMKDLSNILDSQINVLNNPTGNPESHNNNQYFQRVVYGYDTCGLHFNLSDKEKTVKLNDINPFVNVVVYGTDPCALNFPVVLYDEDSFSNVGDYQLSIVTSSENIVEVTDGGDATFLETLSGHKIDESVLESDSETVIHCKFRENLNANHVQFNTMTPYLNNDNNADTQLKSYDSNLFLNTFANYPSTTATSSVDSNSIFCSPEQSSTSQVCVSESDNSNVYAHTVNFVNIDSLRSTQNIDVIRKIQRLSSNKFNCFGSYSRIKFPDSSTGFDNTLNYTNRSRTAVAKDSIHYKTHIVSLRYNDHSTKCRFPLLIQFPDDETLKLRKLYFDRRCNKLCIEGYNKPKSDNAIVRVICNRNIFLILILLTIFLLFFYFWYLVAYNNYFQPPREPERHWYFF